jgi:hypothetical protein
MTRLHMTRRIGVAIAGLLVSCMALGCASSRKFTQVEIRGLGDKERSTPEDPVFLDYGESVTIKNPRIVQKLTDFFPGLGTGRKASMGVWSPPILELVFSDVAGNRVTAYTKLYDLWGSDVDSGDLWVRGDLETYLEALLTDITVEKAISAPYGKVEWKDIKVDVGGESHKVCLKKYPKPVMLKKAMEGFGFEPSRQVRNTAFGTLALSSHIGRRLKTKGDLESYTQLFEFPEKSMAHLKELESKSSGWDELILRIRRSEKMHFEAKKLIGEAIIGDKHVFATRLPGSILLFRVLRRLPNGRYCLVNQWDENLRPLLHENSLIAQFKSDPNAPSRNSVLDGREQIIAEYIAILKTMSADDVMPSGSVSRSAIIVLGEYRAEEAIPQLLRLISVRNKRGLGDLPAGSVPPEWRYPAVGALVKIGTPSVLAIRDAIEKPNAVLNDKKAIDLYIHIMRVVLGSDHIKAWLLEEKSHCPKGAESNYDKLLESLSMKRYSRPKHRRKSAVLRPVAKSANK